MIRLRFLLKQVAALFIIDFVLSKNHISARTLSKLADTLVSIKFITKTIVQLRKRLLYKVIEIQLSSGKKRYIGKYNDTVEETLHWKFS